jgi:hypothetical protein
LETEHVAVPAFGRGLIVHVDMNVVDIEERRCSVGHRGTMRARAGHVATRRSVSIARRTPDEIRPRAAKGRESTGSDPAATRLRERCAFTNRIECGRRGDASTAPHDGFEQRRPAMDSS